ncbi:MAG: tRNA (adenosine(37)-N6)-dimethylallyltransferase MiaA [Chitinophagales bacterium]|nr:tRNA (adenosine(37)-N6)-dimethylallyltransferase MiaA [Chitinophagales bacterium]
MKPTLLVICGPTAVGKTALAIQLAQRWNAEIISADSRQFYREMNIGTAKPSTIELQTVPHHFINNLSVFTKHYSAGKFEFEVLEFLENYFKKNNIAIMVGGSGLFINAVCSGFDKMETDNENERWITRKFLNEQSLEWLQNEVQRLDPEYFAIVDTKNPVRLKRALEIIYATGKKYSEQRIGKKAERPFNIIKIGLQLPREILYQRINERVDQMLQNGLQEEATELYINKKLPALNTVGYSEFFDLIDDKLTLPEAVALIKQNTRNYAKRQLTWFKKDENIHWFQPQETEAITAYIEQTLLP